MPSYKRIVLRDQNKTFLVEFDFVGSDISLEEFKTKVSMALNSWKQTKEFKKYSKQIKNKLSILDLFNLLSSYYMKHKQLRDAIKDQGFSKFNIYNVDFIDIHSSDSSFFRLTETKTSSKILDEGIEVSDYQVSDLTEILTGSQKKNT